MKIFRVWFEPKQGEVCCILVSANTEERAIELSKTQVEDFPELMSANINAQEFDMSIEHASIC